MATTTARKGRLAGIALTVERCRISRWQGTLFFQRWIVRILRSVETRPGDRNCKPGCVFGECAGNFPRATGALSNSELQLQYNAGEFSRCDMPYWVAQLCDRMTHLWLTATPSDYFRISTLVVIFGWVLSRPMR
jgi:hypothetical protein